MKEDYSIFEKFVLIKDYESILLQDLCTCIDNQATTKLIDLLLSRLRTDAISPCNFGRFML